MDKVLILYRRYYDQKRERYEIGGIETYIRNLCKIVVELGAEPHVLVPSAGKNDCLTLPSGEWVHFVSCSIDDTFALVKKAYEIGDVQEDILIFATSTMIVQTRFVNAIGIQHGIYWDTTTIHDIALSGRMVSVIARSIQAKQILSSHSVVSHMVCVDLNYVNWMRALSVDNRLPYIYIPNFADTTTPISKRSNDGVIRVVFARRFEAIRGCELLMDVMPRVLTEHPEIELTIAGTGSMEARLQETFGDNPRVEFTRYDANESISFHSQFDIALVPSIASEGTSLSLLEAMAAGCAVVATDVGGMSNIVLSGHNGLLVRPEANDLYTAVSILIDNSGLRDRLALNACQTVTDSFSRDRWAESWTHVLKGCV